MARRGPACRGPCPAHSCGWRRGAATRCCRWARLLLLLGCCCWGWCRFPPCLPLPPSPCCLPCWLPPRATPLHHAASLSACCHHCHLHLPSGPCPPFAWLCCAGGRCGPVCHSRGGGLLHTRAPHVSTHQVSQWRLLQRRGAGGPAAAPPFLFIDKGSPAALLSATHALVPSLCLLAWCVTVRPWCLGVQQALGSRLWSGGPH